MTRKLAVRIERELKAAGVYKPYVCADKEFIFVESYPLSITIRIASDVDQDFGPYQSFKIYDASLARIGQDSLVECGKFWIGQPMAQVIGSKLVALHATAYERATAQDTEMVLGLSLLRWKDIPLAKAVDDITGNSGPDA